MSNYRYCQYKYNQLLQLSHTYL